MLLILDYCSPLWWSAVEYHLELLSLSVRWPGFAPIKVSWHRVINVTLPVCVCWTGLYTRTASTRVWHNLAAAAAHPLEFRMSRCWNYQFEKCLGRLALFGTCFWLGQHCFSPLCVGTLVPNSTEKMPQLSSSSHCSFI